MYRIAFSADKFVIYHNKYTFNNHLHLRNKVIIHFIQLTVPFIISLFCFEMFALLEYSALVPKHSNTPSLISYTYAEYFTVIIL